MVLKPCKFCGGAAAVHAGYETEFIQCSKCGAKTETYEGDYYDEGFMDGSYAAEYWNAGKVKQEADHE